MAFTATWDETTPTGSATTPVHPNASVPTNEGAANTLDILIQTLKLSVRERMGVEHDWTSGGGTVHHKFLRVTTPNLPTDAVNGTLAWDTTVGHLKMWAGSWFVAATPLDSGTQALLYGTSAPVGWTVSLAPAAKTMLVLAATGGTSAGSGDVVTAWPGSTGTSALHFHNINLSGVNVLGDTDGGDNIPFPGPPGNVAGYPHTHSLNTPGFPTLTDSGHTHTASIDPMRYASHIVVQKS